MKLNVRYKKKPTKTDKQKKIDKSKKEEGPKLLENYRDTNYCDINNTSLNLTQMRYGTIDSCIVDSIETNKGLIKIKNSWIEVLLLMLSNVITDNEDFENKFMNNSVTNMFFIVDKVYGKYTFEQNKYKAYKIPNTEYYLEYIDNSEIIFEALVGLTKCLDIKLDEIKFHLINKTYLDIKLRFNTLEETEKIVGVEELKPMLKNGIHLVAIDVFGEIVEVHNIQSALFIIFNKLINEFGAFRLTTLQSTKSTGIKILEDGDELNKNIMRLRDSEIGVYSDGDEQGILKFILNTVYQLELSEEQIRFKFRYLKRSKYEWEID